eukprot:TRINITY_DN178_c1_g1_i1.p1 TRINITY_DN178_c1_g1~~TRINITY_DN178_c1_g1_i1.p1  ORF type:complete len:267 (+),score=48.72 TRINITY_DN178_c1_g1_i1:47-802(+)
MGYDGGQEVACSAPAMPGTQAVSGERALWDVLNEMGLLEWQGQLNAVGLTTLAAFKMVEEGDLPDGIPRLVRRQIETRAMEMRSKSGRSSEAAPGPAHNNPSSNVINVTVKVITENRSLNLTASPNETMAAFKSRLPPCVPRPHKINFNSLPVEDHTLLCDANITDGALLFLIPTKTGPVPLYVKTPDGAVLSVTCSLHDTVATLKSAVAKEKDCRPSEVCLYYKGQELYTPSKVLYELDCHEGAVFILQD